MKRNSSAVLTWRGGALILAGMIAVQLAWAGNDLVPQMPDAVGQVPDFSYAGYRFGESSLPLATGQSIDVTDFGAVPDDGLDDSKSVNAALEAARKVDGPVVLSFPPGRFILSDILYIDRSHFILRGAGSGKGGTELYYPRPLRTLPNPDAHRELIDYLVALDKRQKEKKNNINLAYSQYAWSGGFIWTGVPGTRIKRYLSSHDESYPQNDEVIGRGTGGQRFGNTLEVDDTSAIAKGDIIQIGWYNRQGKNSDLLRQLYGDAAITAGSHHWDDPDRIIVAQQVLVTSVNGKNEISIKTPLLHNIQADSDVRIQRWAHLEEVGIEHLRMVFPLAPYVAHHVEDGYNGIYLTRLFNGWVKNVVIENSDSGILSENIANVTISDVSTSGDKLAHYTVAMSGTHNVLVDRLNVFNSSVHALSFNTYATRSVYANSSVYAAPALDQHSGANHQNLFDNITVYLEGLSAQKGYPLFQGGGAA
ncbi:MAG: glycosyl hydrolase family 28-related protein, partial [Lysobacterales bacterium]